MAKEIKGTCGTGQVIEGPYGLRPVKDITEHGPHAPHVSGLLSFPFVLPMHFEQHLFLVVLKKYKLCIYSVRGAVLTLPQKVYVKGELECGDAPVDVLYGVEIRF